MAFSDLTQGCLFDPHKLVYKFVSILLKDLESKSVFVVDYPNKEEAVFLYIGKRNLVDDVIVVQRRVVRLDTPHLFDGRKNPWWVHSDHVEKLAG